MRRHEKLIPLSKFHRSCLFLALMAKENAPDIKGYPTELDQKIDYALHFYQYELVGHFEREEKLWLQVRDKSPKLYAIINDLSSERINLVELFTELSHTPSESLLNKLGDLLEKHVRKEERVLFQKIQDELTEKELDQLMY